MKCAQVRSLANEKQYRNAYEVIQTINIDQVTAITDLNTIADVYIQLQNYAEAKEIYLKLYERFPTRRVLYQLVYLSLKCGEIEEAEEFYSEYETIDKSSDKIILRYYIDKTKGADRQTLIRHLQEMKKEDYMEEWAYELAKLYHKEGMSEACVEECSDIILWFGEGLIVEKARLLRYHYIDGVDISSESAIMEGTRNLASELRIAAAIAERNEREQREQAEQLASQQAAYQEAWYAQNQVTYEEEYYRPKPVAYEEEYYKPEPVAYEEEAYYQPESVAYEEEEYQPESVAYEKEEEYYPESVTYEEEKEYQPEPVAYEEEEQSESVAYEEGLTQEELDALEAAERAQADREAELLYVKLENYSENATYKPVYAEPENSCMEREYEEPDYTKPVEEETRVYKDSKDALFEGGFAQIEVALAEIVDDIKKTKSTGHVAITGSNSAKNIEIGKYFAKELCKKGVLPTSKIAKIYAETLNEISLLDSLDQLEGGCLLIEKAGEMSLGSIQSLYQLMRRVKRNMVIILSDTEEELDKLLSKNRKLGKMIEYDIEV